MLGLYRMLRLHRCVVPTALLLATAGLILADEPTVPTLKISRERVCPGTISPYQYGQFIEYLCGLTPSMFAEKVFNGSFEGVPPYAVEFRREIDRIEQPWYADGATHRGEFSLDPAKRAPFTTRWGGLEPGNAGLEEFVKLCQWVGAEALSEDHGGRKREYRHGRQGSTAGRADLPSHP